MDANNIIELSHFQQDSQKNPKNPTAKDESSTLGSKEYLNDLTEILKKLIDISYKFDIDVVQLSGDLTYLIIANDIANNT